MRREIKKWLGKTTITSLSINASRISNRFDDLDLTRPSTAPAPADTAQNRSGLGALSALRTGLEPTKSSDLFANMKSTPESSKANDWLGLKSESSEEEEPPARLTQKYEPVVTTIAKKTPIMPTKETPATMHEAPKKPFIDSFLDDERRILSEKTPLPPPAAPTSNLTQDFLFDDRSTTNKRQSTSGPTKSSWIPDQPASKPTTRSSLDAKSDFGMAKDGTELSFVLHF